MLRNIRLISTDFDGTLVAHASDPVLDPACMAVIAELQKDGAIWAINTGRSVGLLETGLADLSFPIRPDYILTSERDVFRPSRNGGTWEPYGDWNERCARDHAELFQSAKSVLTEIVDFVNQKTKARLIYDATGIEGLIAEDENEMDRIVQFIDQARAAQPNFHYQRNTVYLRFSHCSYHKGAALAELSRLLGISARDAFAAGDHHNDISMLDGRFAAMPACPSNAIDAVQNVVRAAGGYVASKPCGQGVHEALVHFATAELSEAAR